MNEENICGSLVEWLGHRDCDQHGLGSTPISDISP